MYRGSAARAYTVDQPRRRHGTSTLDIRPGELELSYLLGPARVQCGDRAPRSPRLYMSATCWRIGVERALCLTIQPSTHIHHECLTYCYVCASQLKRVLTILSSPKLPGMGAIYDHHSI